jgi:DNA modification methylase
MHSSIQSALFENLDTFKIPRSNGIANKLDNNDRQFHDWYRFVLSFPPHLVREYIDKFGLKPGQTILDPFCGTGTTIVEAKLRDIKGIGIEQNSMAYFASNVKIQWDIDANELVNHATRIANYANEEIKKIKSDNLRKLPIEENKLLLKESISPLPLHKALILKEQIDKQSSPIFNNHELLAFAKCLVFSISNLHFGPEVGVRRNKKIDAPVIESWLSEIKSIAKDISNSDNNTTDSIIYNSDSRELVTLLKPNSISAVFTSPPYPNEKDYTRTTRLESVMLGFIHNKRELQLLKRGLLRSNTRNVYKGDDDDVWVEKHIEIQRIADDIEKKRIKLGKTSGFEKLYGKVTKLYFGGMARHLSNLRPFLKPGAYLGYVVGDQASYLQILIKTGELLADIAKSLGYEIISIDLFRTRLSTATRMQMREEVVVLRWPG